MSVTIQIRDANNQVRKITLKRPISLIGRSIICNIRLHGSMVSPRHAKLRQYREYAIIEDLNSRNGVYVNNNRIQGEAQITLGDQVAFGQAGPTLQITQGFEGTIPATSSGSVIRGQQPSPSDSQPLELEMHTDRKWWVAAVCGFILCLGTLLVAVAFLTGYFATEMWAPGSRSLNAEPIFHKYSDSTFLVCIRVEGRPEVIPLGTAFAIGKDGLCATNAHVVLGAEQQKQELESFLSRKKEINKVGLLLISPGGQHKYEILDTYVHRFYLGQSEGHSPDVGLIKVKLTDSQNMKPIPLASVRNLRRLKKGEELCYIGYPVFDARRDYNLLSKIAPRTFQGNLIRMLDFLEQTASFESAMLLEHSMDTAGGASGSPIFDSSGKVVALLNAGMLAFDEETGEVKKEQRISYGIRVDALRELIKDYQQDHK